MPRIVRPAALKPVSEDVRSTLRSVLESAQTALISPSDDRAKWALFHVSTIAGGFANRWRWRRKAIPLATKKHPTILRGPGSESPRDVGRDALSAIRQALFLADHSPDDDTLRFALAEIEEAAARFTARWPINGQKRNDVTKIG